MHGEHTRVRISSRDVWDATRIWKEQQPVRGALSTLQEFETACGLQFACGMWSEPTPEVEQDAYEYLVMNAHRLMLSIARYGWRVTPITTT